MTRWRRHVSSLQSASCFFSGETFSQFTLKMKPRNIFSLYLLIFCVSTLVFFSFHLFSLSLFLFTYFFHIFSPSFLLCFHHSFSPRCSLFLLFYLFLHLKFFSATVTQGILLTEKFHWINGSYISDRFFVADNNF
jgi:hypothetical protein